VSGTSVNGGAWIVLTMDADVDYDEDTLRRVRERVLEAEQERLHMKLPRNILNDIQEIIEEEVEE
jgi:hypothetical protein